MRACILLLLSLSVGAAKMVDEATITGLVKENIPHSAKLLTLRKDASGSEFRAFNKIFFAYIKGEKDYQQAMTDAKTAAPTFFAALQPLLSHYQSKKDGLKSLEARTFIDENIEHLKSLYAKAGKKEDALFMGKIYQLVESTVEEYANLDMEAKEEMETTFKELFLVWRKSGMKISDLQ